MTRSRSTLVILLAASVALAPACGTLKKVAGGVSPSPLAGAEPDLLTRTLEESVAITRRDARKARNAPPQGVEKELLPPLHVRGSAEGETFDQKFDVTVSDSPAREFFMSLVEGTPYNMVLDPAVDGAVTLTLKNVTIDEVMQAVRAVYGYEYEETSYGYHVRPSGLQTRIYELDYLNVQRSGNSKTVVSTGEASSNSSSGSAGQSSSLSVSGSGGGGVSGSDISTSSQTDFWSELQDILGTIIGSGEGRSVAISPNVGIVVVRAMPAELRAVAKYLYEAEQSLHRQVILEAKILEVRLSDRFQSGVNWALLLDSSMNPIIRAIQTGGGSILEAAAVSEIADNLGFLDELALNVAPAAAGSIRPTPLFGGVFAASVEFDEFSALIELLERQGEVRTLSSPRVSTLNNQKAIIKIGQDEFFVTDVSSTTVTGTTTTTTPEVTLTPFFSGIALDVTPQISKTGDIILHIHPTISSVTDDIKIVSVGGVDQQLPTALSTIRESDSIVRSKSGQIIVIGGLMQETTSKDRAAVPWLGRIPILGYLFRQQLDKVEKTELVTLLRAIIVDENAWKEDIERTAERVKKMTRVRMSGKNAGK